MTVAMVYVFLQSMRSGLVTRFMGSIGIALGATVIFLPPIIVFSAILWTGVFGYLGLMFIGRTPRGRPPAWDAGEAIPWPRRGEEMVAGGDAIEGDATEVRDDTASDSGPKPAPPQKRKRKSRG